MEETASFLQSLLASHGPNYLEKLFGSKARDALAPLGGVEKVAIALSESQVNMDTHVHMSYVTLLIILLNVFSIDHRRFWSRLTFDEI